MSSTRGHLLGVKAAVQRADNLATFMYWLSAIAGSLELLQP
jgi:hypothetical protein